MGTALIDYVGSLKRKIANSIKQSVLNETPPAKETQKIGIPSIRELKGLTERRSISSLLPYESYEEREGLYYNRDTVGFVLMANPSAGLGLTELKILNGIFSQMHRADACIQISLISDTNIEHLLDQWSSRKQQTDDKNKQEIFNILTNNRKEYLSKGKWNSLFSDRPFVLRNIHLLISYTVPLVELEGDVVEELKRIRSAFIGIFKSVKIECDLLRPEGFINLMNAIINPLREEQPVISYNPHELISKQVVDEDTVFLFDSGVSSIIHQNKAFSLLAYHARHFPQRWADI